ncbi:MAG TPA: hypothetical protein VG605_00120 [Puia sp.]|jgi:antitoxin MazE|nr:hypothetical protein [Puia sp.]
MPAKKQKPKKNAASPAKRRTPAKTYKHSGSQSHTGEPAVEYTAKIRPIGNSRGVILNNQLMDFAGLSADEDIVIRATNGQITIKPAEQHTVNTDLSTWEKQLKAAIKAGDKPEGDLWEGMANKFDKTEW